MSCGATSQNLIIFVKMFILKNMFKNFNIFSNLFKVFKENMSLHGYTSRHFQMWNFREFKMFKKSRKVRMCFKVDFKMIFLIFIMDALVCHLTRMQV